MARVVKRGRKDIYFRMDSDDEDSNEDSDDVNDDIEAQMLEGNDLLRGEQLRPIKGTHTYMNSMVALVGRQFSGKTYTATKEIIKIVRAHPETHLVVVINKDGESSDGTFETLKPLILAPVVYVSHDDAVSFMKNLLDYKRVYNEVKASRLESSMPLNYQRELCDNLYIDDLSLPFLHTVVLMEDATKSPLIQKDGGYFNDLFTQCRHIQCTFFLNIHYWKSLTTNIKSNLSTAYVFGNFSRQQLQYILSQMNLEATTKEVYEIYRRLKTYEKIIVDCNTGTFTISS